MSMSFGIFLTAIAVLTCLGLLLGNDVLNLDSKHPRENWFSWTVFATLFISFITFLACAFTFDSYAHLFLSFRYDHVKVYEFKGDDVSMYESLGIDPSTIARRHVGPSSRDGKSHFVTVICAWNDKEDVLKKYESLTDNK